MYLDYYDVTVLVRQSVMSQSTFHVFHLIFWQDILFFYFFYGYTVLDVVS